MTFADIPAGSSIFIDANTFVYHFTPHPVFRVACASLLLRIMRRELPASTSLDVLSDVAHRVMPPATIESTAAGVSQQYGLLSGDALVIATMQHFGISSIASHDADFDRVPGLARYSPI